MIERPTIFISHITEEAEIAGYYKEAIEAAFLGLVTVFVSSDSQSLKLGQNWLDNITVALRHCSAMLVFASPVSISRQWINFECGAGWARSIEVAPICHSGTRPVDLPLPISLLQGIEASDPRKIEQVFRMIAGKLNSAVPSVDYTMLATKAANFEKNYAAAITLDPPLRQILKLLPDFLNVISGLPANQVTPIQGVREAAVRLIEPMLIELQNLQALQWSFEVTNMTIGGGAGSGTSGILNIIASVSLLERARSLQLVRMP